MVYRANGDMKNIYERNGFDDRMEYLEYLSEEYGVKYKDIYDIASIIGAEEDFDALILLVEELSWTGEYA